jgi:hypothetical protein
MGPLSPKLRNMRGSEGKMVGWWCPGCEQLHAVKIEGPHAWTWNGDVNSPTFTPSVLTTYRWSKSLEPGDDPGQWQDDICHCFVTDGQIQFLGDCTHGLLGQAVPMPDLPDWLRD